MKVWMGAALGVLLAAAGVAQAAEVSVSASPITQFGDSMVDQMAGELIFRGGIALVSQDAIFGGLSGLTMTGPDGQVVFVSDRGNFVGGQLAYDNDGRLLSLIGVTVEPMRNSRGEPLPRQFARDAESVDTVYRNGQPVAVRVGFENLTRVADFDLSGAMPGGAAREVPIPAWLSELRTNQTLESVCVAPPASPIAGSTLLLPEEALDSDGNHRGWLLGQADTGRIGYRKSPVVSPTECAFLPNGDLLVLERGLSVFNFVMNLRRVPADEVRPGNLMEGELLLSASGGTIDNMESMTVHRAPNGELRVLIGSDNNYNDWQRTLLLDFALPE